MNSGPAGSSPAILTVTNVSLTFGARRALRDVSLEVRPGEIYALLGPNGAGKTTLSRAICGRLKPDGGEVRLIGRDPFNDGEARAALGLAPQALALYPQLTVAENLETFARLAGLKGSAVADSVVRVMAVTRIAERARSLVRSLSGGFQRRVNIAAAILAGPKLLVLDEPTVGVDMPAREAVSDALRQLRSEGVGVLLITHDLEHAGALADRVGFLREGQLVMEGAPDDLIAAAFGDRMEVEVDVGEGGSGQEALTHEGLTPGASAGVWTCLTADGYAMAARLGERLKSQGIDVREIRVHRPSLRNLFTEVAGQRQAA